MDEVNVQPEVLKEVRGVFGQMVTKPPEFPPHPYDISQRCDPPLTLKGIDPKYHPSQGDRKISKSFFPNNCSLSVLSGHWFMDAFHDMKKYLEYFWNHKGESLDLQTPGYLISTLQYPTQNKQIRDLIKNGFKIIDTFPSCHGEGNNKLIVILGIQNPISSEYPQYKLLLKAFNETIDKESSSMSDSNDGELVL